MVRYAVRVLVLLLALPTVLVPAPTQAAQAVPWRFSIQGSLQSSFSSGQTKAVTATCPDGYVLVGGGFSTSEPSQLELVAQYRSSATEWTVIAHAYAAMTVKAWPVCAWGSHVDSITTVSADLPRDAGTGVASGVLNCPVGQKALFAGFDWNTAVNAGTRRIDGAAPAANGNGWGVSAWSPVDDSLHAEMYCISATALGGVTGPIVQNVAPDSATTFDTAVSCPAGQRTLSGGALAGSGSGAVLNTEALSVAGAYAEVTTGVRLLGHKFPGTGIYKAAWCIPASVPSVFYESAPPTRDNQTSFQFSFGVVEPTGEQVLVYCYLDDVLLTSDCSDGKRLVSNLGAGPHTFTVRVLNRSWQSIDASHTWTVDLTAPTVSDIDQFATLGSTVNILFSEDVTGVSGSTVFVAKVDSQDVVPGKLVVVDGDSATWSPAGRLVPGERYEMVFSGVSDVAGNAMPPQAIPLGVPVRVSTDDPSLVETWDVDKAKAASGGSYATSRGKGSSLTWTFSSGAGKKAVVYGVKSPRSGKAAVYVDGVKKATVSLYATRAGYNLPVFTSSALSAGQHKVEVRVLGSKARASQGTWVGLDRLKVGTTVQQESKARHRFRTVVTTEALDGSYDTVDHMSAKDTGAAPSYSLVFRGTEVHVYGTFTPTSGSARLYVDGVLKATVSLKGATFYREEIGGVTGLTDAVHTLRIVPVGTATGASSAVGVDVVRVGPLN